MTFDPKRRLVMASFKTVMGHSLPAGTPLAIVEEPSARGEVDEAMARRLYASKVAGYEDEVYATPVETPEQERNRLALEALREPGPPGDPDVVNATNDLLVWPADDAETGKKAGQKVTKDDLIVIAGRESVVIETDDNKVDLIRKIMEVRAARAVQNGTNAETDGAGGQGDTAGQGATGPGTDEGAETGAVGDQHGEAGEGEGD